MIGGGPLSFNPIADADGPLVTRSVTFPLVSGVNGGVSLSFDVRVSLEITATASGGGGVADPSSGPLQVTGTATITPAPGYEIQGGSSMGVV